MYRVYVKTDEKNRLIEINSDSFLTDLTGWTQIDQGDGDRFHHAQGHYLEKPLMTDEGVPRYELNVGKVKERSMEEIQADINALPEPKLTVSEIMFRALAQTEVIRAEDALDNAGMFPGWRAGEKAVVGAYWRHEDVLYRVVQEHTTQEGWGPDALFAKTELQGEYRLIPDPITAEQAFSKGEIGIWTDGKKYRAKSNGTVWTPAQYPAAWEEV